MYPLSRQAVLRIRKQPNTRNNRMTKVTRKLSKTATVNKYCNGDAFGSHLPEKSERLYSLREQAQACDREM